MVADTKNTVQRHIQLQLWLKLYTFLAQKLPFTSCSPLNISIFLILLFALRSFIWIFNIPLDISDVWHLYCNVSSKSCSSTWYNLTSKARATCHYQTAIDSFLLTLWARHCSLSLVHNGLQLTQPARATRPVKVHVRGVAFSAPRSST